MQKMMRYPLINTFLIVCLLACSEHSGASDKVITVPAPKIENPLPSESSTDTLVNLEEIAKKPSAPAVLEETKSVQSLPESKSIKAIESQGKVAEPILEENTLKDVSLGQQTPDNKVAAIEEIKVKSTAASHAPTIVFDHQAWDQFLKTHVSASGKVDYTAIAKNPTDLNSYTTAISQNPPSNAWSKSQTMAYWINAYNAFTIKKIIDNWPLKSIMDLDGGKTWDVKWIKIGSTTYSLNQIEHEILRPVYKDARIHFAVNCAARSCPPLLNRAWTADRLEQLLQQQTGAFINNPNYNKISSTAISLSKIFEWYAEDFGDLIPYLNAYLKNPIDKQVKISYMDYDWALND